MRNYPSNGRWKDVTVEFTATQTIPNARLDIEVPKDKQYLCSIRPGAAKWSPAQAKFGSV